MPFPVFVPPVARFYPFWVDVETASTLLGSSLRLFNVGVPFPLCPSLPWWSIEEHRAVLEAACVTPWLVVFVSDFPNCPYKPASVCKLLEKN